MTHYHLAVITAKTRLRDPGEGRDLPSRGQSIRQCDLSGIGVVLAPLCGVTDAIFRRICLRYGADLAVTEMVSSEAVARGHSGIRSMRNLDTREGPLSIQIFGADPESMGTAAEILSELDPLFIDMNFGCPVRKIVRANGGAAVLRDPGLLGRICRAVVKGSHVPVSAKIRTGWGKPTARTVREIARVIEDSGVSMIAVHARARAQMLAEKADWELIRAVKETVSIPVIGNGDVRHADDYFAIRGQTNCDAVMVGRAAIGNPWIFAEIQARREGRVFSPPTPRERIRVLKYHLRESVKDLGEWLGIIASRRVLGAYLRYLPGASVLRRKIMSLCRCVEIESVLDRYLEENSF